MSPRPRPLTVRSALDQLADDARCLAAVFLSYTFSPAFFEDQVLRTLLRLRSDPQEHTTDYLHEAIGELQKTPIACFVDAGARTPGQRLPYELHLISARVFHPKLALLARDDHARLLLGSGNLTRGGYGENTELWSSLRLDYTSPSDVALLRDLLAALRDVERLSGRTSPALGELARVLHARISDTPAPQTSPSYQLLHSLHTPILPAFLRMLPTTATIVQVGVLAPFYELDDTGAWTPDEVDGVLATILKSRPSAEAIVDMGFTWAGGPLTPPATIEPLLATPDTLWVHRIVGDPPSLEYFTPRQWTAASLRYCDDRGAARMWAREGAERAWSARVLFPAAPCVAHGPQQLVAHLRDRYSLQTWLYPTLRLEAGRPVHRPLHAKLIAVVVATATRETTYLLIGSPNASRRALLTPGGQSNVEFAMLLALAGRRTLADLVPELVACAADQLVLTTPQFLVTTTAITAFIDAVDYDAQTRELRVLWRDPHIHDAITYRVAYRDRTLASGPALPVGVQRFSDFELHPTRCELLIQLGDEVYSYPILVHNLAALKVEEFAASYDLTALIALLSRRISAVRLRQLMRQGATAPDDSSPALAALLGEDFTPTDVFRMFHALAHELADPERSLPAFRHVLQRPTGVLAVWQALQAALGGPLSREQLWFYGSELVRSLETLTIPADADHADKAAQLAALVARLRGQLTEFTPSAAGRPWVDEIVKFYG